MSYTKLKVIPTPKCVCGADSDGKFTLLSIKSEIITDIPDFKIYAETFAVYAERIHSVKFVPGNDGINILRDLRLAKGAYRIECDENCVKLYACEKDGVTNGLSTIIQMLHTEDGVVSLPRVRIEDRPDCEYRSLMVDLARQWHSFNTLLEYVDLCYLYKIKYLHLHFIDNQSYTLPSDILPKLPTEGRHYTKSQIAELNEYAKARNVELIPELEMPGHAAAMVSAYPELFANDLFEEVTESSDPKIFKSKFKNNIICAGKEGIFDTLKKLMIEITGMFPYSKYLHIGGDEATINYWDMCKDCKKFMAENNINGVRELYTYFIKVVTDMVLEIGKTPIVWEGFPKEGSEAISRDVLVIAWESLYHLPTDLVAEGFNIINGSWKPLYITPIHGNWGAKEILDWNIYTWKNWWIESEACLNPIHLQPTHQVKGSVLCVWEDNYDGEIGRIRENLAAFSERTWNIRRFVTDEQFGEKLECLLKMAKKLAVKE